LLRAVIAHIYIAWIHPFGDGNGRCARLVELNILIAAGVPSIAAHLLSNHYNLTRPQYLEQLRESSKTTRIEPFIAYAVQGFLDQLNEQQKVINRFLDQITWKDFVHSVFYEESGESSKRRRNLALTLGIDYPHQWVLKKRLAKLTPDIAAAYASKTAKTLSRDLNDLAERGLLEATRTHARAAISQLEVFRTECKREDSTPLPGILL
jgi:Fic family protein